MLVARALLGGGVLADREALPNSGLAVWLDRGSGLPVASISIRLACTPNEDIAHVFFCFDSSSPLAMLTELKVQNNASAFMQLFP